MSNVVTTVIANPTDQVLRLLRRPRSPREQAEAFDWEIVSEQKIQPDEPRQQAAINYEI